MTKKLNQLRIIGGQWRGRNIQFPDLPGIRPTPNRVRETVFNWLMHDIQDAYCLDLFAGSGALGFEALSRGAAEVVFVDESPQAIQSIVSNAEKLGADNYNVRCLRLPYDISHSIEQPADIVFLDPPFKQGLVAKMIKWLKNADILAKNALLYVETEAELTPLPVPNHWQVLKNKVTGHVAYYLVAKL